MDGKVRWRCGSSVSRFVGKLATSFTRALDKGYIVDFMSMTWISLTLRPLYPRRGDGHSSLVTGKDIFCQKAVCYKVPEDVCFPLFLEMIEMEGQTWLFLLGLTFPSYLPRVLMFQWVLHTVHVLVVIDANFVKKGPAGFSYVFSGPLRYWISCVLKNLETCYLFVMEEGDGEGRIMFSDPLGNVIGEVLLGLFQILGKGFDILVGNGNTRLILQQMIEALHLRM
ncbi:hypothetical protein V6N13_030168 [Hibiscus sabdariffa]